MEKIIPFKELNEKDYNELKKNNKAMIDKVNEELARLSKRGYVLPNELSEVLEKVLYVLTLDDILSDLFKEANKDEQRA